MKKTKFNRIHKTLGAKMVEFAGYEMPIQYSSIIAEHKAVRNSVGVFDVSHMGEIFITGDKALDFVQHITINDASKLFPGRVQYSAMCYPDGGIVDDLLVYKIADMDMIISRTGYTGEIGYELYFTGDESTAEKVWSEIFTAGKEFDIQPVGLAARDSLRLEMGYCLYGNDIDQTTNPIEAGLGWVTKIDKAEFIGKESILKVKQDGINRKLVAMISDEKTFPRKGYEIISSGKKAGIITSGTVSPVLEKPIALGYVDKPYSSPGSEVSFKIRDKEIPARITKLPFVKK